VCVPRSTPGITTFDTADVYADTRPRSVLGAALEGTAATPSSCSPRSTGAPRLVPNGSGLSRKHVMSSIDGSLRRLRTDYVDLYQAHRYDHETPLEETMQAFADIVRAGKALYIGVSEWTAEQIRAGVTLAATSGSS
jgi:aryl-alcohol dehydrogenase-like predicted oxidoreductase